LQSVRYLYPAECSEVPAPPRVRRIDRQTEGRRSTAVASTVVTCRRITATTAAGGGGSSSGGGGGSGVCALQIRNRVYERVSNEYML